MALENEVAALVTSTTALQSTVGAELAKVRAENTVFKNGLDTQVTTKRLDVSHSSYAPIVLGNTSKIGDGLTRSYAFFNFKAGEVGGPNWNGFAIYSYKYATATSTSPTEIGIPFTIFDNASFSLGGYQPSPMASQTYAIGDQALNASLQFINTVGLGASSNVTGNNQIQLGSPSVTVFSQNAIQLRSDIRDKADVRPTSLGLDFIKALKPVDYRWDVREFYRTVMPSPPVFLAEASSEGEQIAYKSAMVAYEIAIKEWQESSKTENLKPDGTKKRSRFHHGLIAQDVEELIRSSGQDFGGFQDHKRSGGQDVLSVGYSELIAPLIKAIQELAQSNEELRARITTLEARK